MDVSTQLLALALSIGFGILVGIINKKISNRYRIVINIFLALAYFIVLYFINYGELHYYFLIMFICGFYIGSK